MISQNDFYYDNWFPWVLFCGFTNFPFDLIESSIFSKKIYNKSHWLYKFEDCEVLINQQNVWYNRFAFPNKPITKYDRELRPWAALDDDDGDEDDEEALSFWLTNFRYGNQNITINHRFNGSLIKKSICIAWKSIFFGVPVDHCRRRCGSNETFLY